MNDAIRGSDSVGILGAGSIGCYLGGRIAIAGIDPILVGRQEMIDRLSAGLTISDHTGCHITVDPSHYRLANNVAALSDCGTVLVCVKSRDTESAAAQLQTKLRPDALVVSCQNGIRNAQALREKLPDSKVLAAMIGFNVARIGENRFHCGTEGEIFLEADPRAEALCHLLGAAGLGCEQRSDMDAVLWGKLLLNLNNAVNALSGLPLKRQLSSRPYRKVLAAAVREALAILEKAEIHPAQIGRVKPSQIPRILELPDWLFRIVAAGMLKIDGQARSSMAEDLESARMPEIDWLNGEIVALAAKTGQPAPVNSRLVELVHSAHAKGGSAAFSGEELIRATGIAGEPAV